MTLWSSLSKHGKVHTVKDSVMAHYDHISLQPILDKCIYYNDFINNHKQSAVWQVLFSDDVIINVCLEYENMEDFVSQPEFISSWQNKSSKNLDNEQKIWRRYGGGSILGRFITNITGIKIESDIRRIETIWTLNHLSSLWSFFLKDLRQLSSCWWFFSLNNKLKFGCENDVNVSKEARVKQIHKFWKQYVKYVNQAQLSVRGGYIKLLGWL